MQIFYIDSDEEITSVIDRLKKSKEGEIFFVVPKRALVLQSTVNLKLLKKEGERLKKEIIFVTQDQQGKVFARKAGISLGSLPKEVNDSAEKKLAGEEEELITKKTGRKNRLESIGSKEFFDAGASEPQRIAKTPGKIIRLKLKEEKAIQSPIAEKSFYHEKSFNPAREEKLKRMFLADYDKKTDRYDTRHAAPVSTKIKKTFIILGISCFIVATAVAAYLFVPRAEIIIYPRHETKEINIEITGKDGRESADNSLKAIPAKIAEKEKEITSSYPATGNSSLSGQKAHGKVTIFNEYSSSSQTLVATTRLLSQEGKLFRLAKSVTVPGMSTKEGKTEPGKVETEVMADEAGEEYNIGPSRFSIPGFSGGPKYEKFYALSENPIAGGSSSGEKTLNVSQQDIDEAKKKTEAEAKKLAEEELKKELSEGEIFLSGAAEEIILESSSLARTGDAKDIFEYHVKAKLKTFVFSEKYVKEITADKLKEGLGDKMTANLDSVQLEYRYTDADFEKRIIRFKVQGKITAFQKVNLEELKKELLGKNSGQIEDVLRKHSEIEKVEINFWPQFISSRIPPYERQVKIKLPS